jgi:hypothetical protein
VSVLGRIPKLWTPRQDMDKGEPTMVCRVPVDADGNLCLHPFYEGEERAWRDHVGKCARDHMDAIRANSPRVRHPWSDPETWDPEYEAHMKKVGDRMLAEGRLETRPNEV